MDHWPIAAAQQRKDENVIPKSLLSLSSRLVPSLPAVFLWRAKNNRQLINES